MTPVAMATTFETKWVMTQLVWEILPRCLHPVVGFCGWAIERCQTNSTTIDPSCPTGIEWVNVFLMAHQHK